MSSLETSPPVLTIFTPTYNRADLLPRLFRSISQQVAAGGAVEWVVLDDGSTDDTASVLESLSAERPDLVRFHQVGNGGKHRAINMAAQLARADWIMLVDSDDQVASGAIREVIEQVSHIDRDIEVGLIRALRRFPELPCSSSRFKLPRNPCHHAEWISAQRPFDSVEIIRRSALTRYSFPEHRGERFMAEGWLWHSLDQTHLTLFVDREWVEGFYQPEGLSAHSLRIRAMSPLGAMDVYSAILAAPVPWYLRIRAAANWWRYYFHAGRGVTRLNSTAPVSKLLAPIGWLLSWHDGRKLR